MLTEMSASEQAAAVRAGELSATELVDAALDAIERLNGEINAVVTVEAVRRNVPLCRGVWTCGRKHRACCSTSAIENGTARAAGAALAFRTGIRR